ncbi:MAG: GerMN domain-containing protein [Clostridia bacterium]|nr:GerMN domain-containing protein [Clostridia bacterium]
MSRKFLILFTILIFLTFALVGCGVVDKLLSIKEDFKGAENSEEDINEQLGEIEVDITSPQGSDLVVGEPIEYKKVLLYFGSADGKHLVAVEKEIPKVEGIARETINALIEGPDFQSGLLPTIPAGTSLLDINVKENGLCIVDFSKELVANLPGGEQNEQLAVYSIVNTLCQFPTIDQVEFRVEGQKMDTLLGYVQLDPAVSANADMVIKR